MKILLYMAMSANGIIAGDDNSEDFLSYHNWEVLCKLAKQYGCFIWGRKTYDIVQKWGAEYQNKEISNATKIIVSHNTSLKLKNGYTLANSPRDAINILSRGGFKQAILTGGSHINSAFAKEGLIDEVFINIEPIFIGKGIPLFAPESFRLGLKLNSIDRFSNDGVSLHYFVVK